MTYLNLPLRLLRSDLFTDATHEQKGVWLDLMEYCCDQENGGNIHFTEEWSDEKWRNKCGVSLAQVQQPSPLWHFNDATSSLNVHDYPKEHEKRTQNQRAAAVKTNEARFSGNNGTHLKKKVPYKPIKKKDLQNTDAERGR